MNVKKTAHALGLAILIAMVAPLRAQTGCTDSPEGPHSCSGAGGRSRCAGCVGVARGVGT